MYVRKAIMINGNMSVVVLDLEAGFFAAANYTCVLIFSDFEVRWFAEGYGIDIAEWFKQIKLNLNT